MDDASLDAKRTYVLELTRDTELIAKLDAPEGCDLRRVEIPCPELNWFFHQAVGAEFRWGGREDWDRARWLEYVGRPELETWIVSLRGTPAGYFELEDERNGSARIHCLGLLRQFFGQGLGGLLLTRAVERAWTLGARRVWLTTCSHDHPHALGNYLARGFRVVRKTTGSPNRPRRSALFFSGFFE